MATSLSIWFSRTSDYENFDEDVNDSSSFSLAIPSTNEFRWIEGVESLLIGTAGEEWRIYSSKLEAPCKLSRAIAFFASDVLVII